MANWRCTVEAYDLIEQYEEDFDALAFTKAVGVRVRDAVNATPFMEFDETLAMLLLDADEGFYRTEDEANEFLDDLWNWGDAGARMFLNTAFAPAAA